MTELEKLKEQLVKQGFNEKFINYEKDCIEYKGLRFHYYRRNK